MIYIIIFLCKVIENTLTTLRIILISNGKKILGAIIQGFVALIWIFSTGIVIININKDPIKIVSFIIGSIVGSYLGSKLEEIIALGSIMMIIKSKKDLHSILNKYKYFKYDDYYFITCKRKSRKNIVNKIKEIDNNSSIINLKIK